MLYSSFFSAASLLLAFAMVPCRSRQWPYLIGAHQQMIFVTVAFAVWIAFLDLRWCATIAGLAATDLLCTCAFICHCVGEAHGQKCWRKPLFHRYCGSSLWCSHRALQTWFCGELCVFFAESCFVVMGCSRHVCMCDYGCDCSCVFVATAFIGELQKSFLEMQKSLSLFFVVSLVCLFLSE